MRSSGSTSVDDDLAARRGSEPDERRNLDVIRTDAEVAASELRLARDVEDVRADALDLRADRHEEAAEILDVRLAGRVAEDRLSLGEHGGHDRVLRSHDRRLVEVHARPSQPVGRELVDAVDRDVRAERGERVDVRVQPPPADDVATGRRNRDATEAREERSCQEERGADLARELGVEIGLRPMPLASTRTSFGPVHSMSAPRSASSSTIVSTSRMRGTFERRTSSEASTHAARIGSAPFLFPEARTDPFSGRPPSMTKDCIARAMLLAVFTGLLCVERLAISSLGIAPAGSKPRTCA